MSKVHIEQGGQENCLVHYLFICNGWERKKCNKTIQVRYKEKLSNYERSEAWEQVIQESHLLPPRLIKVGLASIWQGRFGSI